MFFQLLKQSDAPLYIMKKDLNYTPITTKSLRFLDILRYQGSKTTLRSFLKSFSNIVADSEDPDDCTKLYFPYHLLTKNVSEMENKGIPEYKDFEDDLKGGHLLEQEGVQYRQLISRGNSREEALKLLNLKSPPPSGPEIYQNLVDFWKRKGYTNLLQILKAYSIADVKPLLTVVEYQRNLYLDMGILPFHSFTSLPNLALSFVMKKSNAQFFLPDEQFHKTLQTSLLGRPSLVFNRFCELGQSKINPHFFENPKAARSLWAANQNAMYMYCLGLPQLTGFWYL